MIMKSPIADPVQVSGIDQIDLDSHAVIEASAGTGKTHTIENLVVALLKTGKIMSLEEILVVTFTEKAAGELKDRIRQNIKKELKNHNSEILQIALDNFDSASIFTIHGFCNSILKEYAFENGEQFENELADDRAVFQQVLYHIMRHVWPDRFGKELQKVLKISRYPGLTVNGTSSWENRVLEVAIRYQSSGNDTLIPDCGSDLLSMIHETEKECQAYLDKLELLIGRIDRNDISKSDFPTRYATLNINKSSMNKRLRIIENIVKLIADRRTRTLYLDDIDDFFSALGLGEDGFNEFNSRWKKEGSDYKDKLPHLPEIIQTLEKLRTLDLRNTQNMLTAITVQDLKRHSCELKKAKGLISYDDMVTRVYDALTSQPSTLKKVLHQKYRYALVDEFQDTDMLQWKIFSAIFLDSKTSRLFIIGDPKQSIYGFRGADVHAYYIARDEMIHTYGARYYCLTANWRSSPDLITSFNTIFAGRQWFSDSNIHYLPSYYPDQQDPEKHSDAKSLIIMDCGSSSGSAAKYKTARFIANELKRLISENPSINLNEIAILVTKWKEAEIIEKFLKEHAISYSLYKKEGLYQSREALELLLLMTALANPHEIMARKKAMVTRFFRVPIQQLYHYTTTIQEQPADILFKSWINLADQKQWPLLFQSIMEDTGILFFPDMDDYDRVIINYRSIIKNLETEAYRNDFCIQEIVDFLNSLRQRNANSHDSYNIQSIDLDKPGVQILTIHASKGLQFKTVFIAGGYTKKDTAEFWTYHTDSGRVLDLVRHPGNMELYNMEKASEDERLFYVALTRAQDRLYIPVFEPASRSKNTAGILGLKIYSALNLMRRDNQVTWVDINLAEDIDTSVQKRFAKMSEDMILPEPLFPDISNNFLNRKIFIDSFSGLKTKLYDFTQRDHVENQFENIGFRQHEDDERYSITGNQSTVKESIHELPRSKETGIMLHAIFEHIDFQQAGNAQSPVELTARGTETSGIIEQAINDHLIFYAGTDMDSITNQTARIIWNTLNTPLNGKDLYLKQLNKRIHEVEFYYPDPHIPSFNVPETLYNQGFMHGFIDMIFLFQDKYYIIDWKSNYIEEGYARDQIEKNILYMHYDLQINIYISAVLRWLEQLIPDYNYNKHFGGIYYLYLRGMDSTNHRNGIYFFRPDDGVFRNY